MMSMGKGGILNRLGVTRVELVSFCFVCGVDTQ